LTLRQEKQEKRASSHPNICSRVSDGYVFPCLRLVRGLCLYLLGFAFCRLTDYGLWVWLWPGITDPPPYFRIFRLHPPRCPLGSYFYLRGELECCQIVILLLRCGFIHSIRLRPQPASRFSLGWHTEYGIPLYHHPCPFAPASICTRRMSPESKFLTQPPPEFPDFSGTLCVFCFVMLHLAECGPNRCSI